MLEAGALQRLRGAFEPPVTCFVNGEGFAEPPLAIWTPVALRRLKGNVGTGRCGPSCTVRCLGGEGVSPVEEGWVVYPNSPEEWEAVRGADKGFLRSRGGVGEAEERVESACECSLQ